MAGPAKNVVNPTTGEKGSVDEAKLARAHATGARDMSDEEATTILEQQRHDADILETHAAGAIGKVRGVGEAFGLPVDAMATSVGGDSTKAYLNDLKKWHPYATGLGELSGQVGGTLAGGEILGGGGAATKAPTVAGRVLQAAGSAAARGGLENLVIGSTHDVNETALGNADLAGEKLFAQMPKHFAMGAGPGLVLGAAGEGLGEAWAAAGRKAPALLNRAADTALGRELGGGAEIGAEIRGHFGGGIPRSSAEISQALTKEQAAFREASAAQSMATKDALAGKHTTASWEQSAAQEAERLRVAKKSKAVVDEIASQHATAREALSAQHGEAASAALKLGEERAAARQQLRNLASDLDKVKGATLPDAKSIMREATDAFLGAGPSLTPPSPRAQQLFSEWADTFSARYDQPGKLTFRELQGVIKSLDTMETRQRVVSGWGSDPEVKKAFDALRSSAKSEFDRASEATANSVSEAKGLSAARLRETIPSLDKAHAEALDHVDTIQQSVLDFERKSALELKLAQREAAVQQKTFERTAKAEGRTLDQSQRAEARAIPKPSKATPVDTLLGKVKSPAEKGGGGIASMGALLSLLHGNVAGAAVSLAGGFAANTAKAHGNLLAARTLRALAEHIASTDGSIARLAGRAVGRYVRQGPEVASEERPGRKEITFEKAVKGVRDAQDNPLILEQRVRMQAGAWAQQAPSVYSSLLGTAQRAQAFLESKLPPSRADPYSPTPHLEHDDLSDSEKYDFVEYAKALRDPVGAMADVVEGNGSPQQVEAVAAVTPGIYGQAKAEVARRLSTLKSPLAYEQLVNVGTLLQMDTAEVMTSEFQSMLADMYTERSKGEEMPGGSKPRGVNSRLSKSMSSASQQMQAGEI